MRIKLLLLFIFLFTFVQINAQTDFRAGYVIKENNDTLFGEIDYRGDFSMGERCRFRLNEKERVNIFYPNEILGYRFNDSKYFVSKEVNDKQVFLEYLVNGEINIYYLRDNNGDHYFLDKEGSTITEIRYNEEIRYIGNTQYLHKSTEHIGLLNFYMQDAPDFQSRIAKINKPEHENLIKLAKDYHNKVCEDGACVIYEKKASLFKFDIEIKGGIANYNNEDINKKNYFQAGVLAHFWMPRISEKLYFRTGMLYSYLERSNDHVSVYKFPIQIEYIYPTGIVRPKVALGINLYKPFYQSPALMGGVNIKLHKSVFLSIDYDIDFNPNMNFPLLPHDLLSQSFLAGIFIKL